MKLRRRSNILFLAGLIGFCLAGPAVATASLDQRDSEPVVVTGADTPRLAGTDPDVVVAFSWIDSAWLQVPVQVDERKMIDFRPVRQLNFNSDNEFRAMAYADPDTWAEADGVPQTVTDSSNRGSRLSSWSVTTRDSPCEGQPHCGGVVKPAHPPPPFVARPRTSHSPRF